MTQNRLVRVDGVEPMRDLSGEKTLYGKLLDVDRHRRDPPYVPHVRRFTDARGRELFAVVLELDGIPRKIARPFFSKQRAVRFWEKTAARHKRHGYSLEELELASKKEGARLFDT